MSEGFYLCAVRTPKSLFFGLMTGVHAEKVPSRVGLGRWAVDRYLQVLLQDSQSSAALV